ncbi:MAG: ATP synthase [Cyanobacteriota bacterium]|nr:ATP synthase [Cyanobacteriota bacterium]
MQANLVSAQVAHAQADSAQTDELAAAVTLCCDADPDPSATTVADPCDPLADYVRLQRRLQIATVVVSLIAVLIGWAIGGAEVAPSLLLGACCGLLYLRLLARSVSRLGPDSRSIGRLQLLVPCLLVIVSSRIPAIHLLPAFIGFVLYKPALLLQSFLAP